MTLSKTGRGAWILRTCVAMLIAWLMPVASPDAIAQAPAESKPRVLLAYEYAGGDALLADAADSGLREALAMAPARLRLLTQQIDQMAMVPHEAIHVLCSLLSRPHSLAIAHGGTNPDTGAPEIGFRLNMDFEDAAEAQTLRNNLRMILTNLIGVPIQRNDAGADVFATPLGAGSMEARTDDDGGAFLLTLGQSAEDIALPAIPTPPGASTVFRGLLDLGPLADFLEGMGAGDPDIRAAGAMGMLNGLRARQTFVLAREGADLYWNRRTFDMRTLMPGMGLGETPLQNQDLRVIPADAMFAWIASMDLVRMWDTYAELLLNEQTEIGDMLDRFTLRTGVDLRRDVIGSLGSPVAVYMSDSTGASGLLSVAGVIKLNDVDTFTRSLNSLIDAANTELAKADIPVGAIQIQRWSRDGGDYFSLRFPGLPIPLEITCSIAGDWFVIGATPQGAMAAAAQAKRRGDLGLPTNRSFREGRFETPTAPVAVMFIDMPRSVGRGYSLASLVGSAIANGVRTEGRNGDSLVVVPMYSALTKDVRAYVGLSYWDGDDWVSEGRTDGSVIANGAGAVGAAGGASSAVSAPLAVGIMLPALGRAREQASALKDGANLKQITVGVLRYAAQNRDIGPENIEDLIDLGLATEELLESPMGPVGDGGPDYFFVSSVRISFDSQKVMGYSRAGYAAGDKVSVVFCDGHVELLTRDEFQRLIRTPKNRDTEWNLPRVGGDHPGF